MIVQTHRALVPEDLRAEIEHAARWVKEQDRLHLQQANREEISADLRRALAIEGPTTQLQAIYAELRATELEVPDDLRHEYQARVAAETRERRRQSRNWLLTVVFLSAMLVLGIGLFVAWMYLSARSR